jgi:hypothetical protein
MFLHGTYFPYLSNELEIITTKSMQMQAKKFSIGISYCVLFEFLPHKICRFDHIYEQECSMAIEKL